MNSLNTRFTEEFERPFNNEEGIFHYSEFISTIYCITDEVIKRGPSKTCGRQLLKNFTWSTLKYFVQFNFEIFYNFLIEYK